MGNDKFSSMKLIHNQEHAKHIKLTLTVDIVVSRFRLRHHQNSWEKN